MKILNKFIASALAIIIGGCASPYPYSYMSNQQAGMQTGAIIGGVTAYEISGGGAAETIGGTVLGAMVGSAIGQSMDRHDQMMAENAITDVPMYQDTTWTNDDTGATYTVTSVNEFKKGNSHCRKAKIIMRARNSVETTTTTMCRREGKWYADR